jgi:hypothetical protein
MNMRVGGALSPNLGTYKEARMYLNASSILEPR